MPLPRAKPAPLPTTQFIPIESFGWDQDPYPGKWVSVYITSGVDGVGDVKDRVTCKFTCDSFDLQILDLQGKDYRLYKNNLDKEIDPDQSKVVVKQNRVTVKLRKKEGRYGTEHWTDLTAKRKRKDKDVADDPSAGIMDLMRDLYEDGDDNMRKTIGEAMLKSRQPKAGAGGLDDDFD